MKIIKSAQYALSHQTLFSNYVRQIGLLSLDPLLLVIKIRGGQTPEERRQAEKLLPLIKQHHQLLVTLLLLNTIAGEALPVCLQGMVPDSVAILVSVVLVLVFGEILPTALFTGPNQLKIASRLAPMVKLIMAIMWPVVYPIAKLLDRIMSDDDESDQPQNGNGAEQEGHAVGGTLYNRGELAALIRVQYEERVIAKQRRKHQRKVSIASIADMNVPVSDIDPLSDVRQLKQELIQHQHALNKQPALQQQQQHPFHHHHNNNNNHGSKHRRAPTSDSIDHDEVMIMEGALQLKTKKAVDIYLSFHKVFCIPYDMQLDDANIFSIYASGYSRVPVYVNNDRRRIKGILMTRQLMVVKNPQQPKRRNSKPDTYDIDIPATDTTMHVYDLNLHVPQCVSPGTNLVDLVNLFQTGGSAIRAGHMALVCARPDVANEALEQDQGVPAEAGLMGYVGIGWYS